MSLSFPLAEARNPQHTLTATVEQDGRTAYFYLWPDEPLRGQFPVRGCWLRNLLPAPAEPDRAALEQGVPPLLSADFCRTLAPEPLLDPAAIEIIWEPAGEGAALWYRGQLLAVIPGWSLYQQAQVSFSAGCIASNPLTAPLGSASTNRHYARAEQHRQHWREEQAGQRWAASQQEIAASYARQFGPPCNLYRLEQVSGPPLILSQHLHQGVWHFLTLGMASRPMPAGAILPDPETPPRAELALAIDAQIISEAHALRLASALAGLAPAPWQHFSPLREGSVFSVGGSPLGFDGFLLSERLTEASGRLNLPAVEEDRCVLLWGTPLTAAELVAAGQHGDGGATLIARLRAQGCTHIFRPRQGIEDDAVT